MDNWISRGEISEKALEIEKFNVFYADFSDSVEIDCDVVNGSAYNLPQID